MDKKFRCSKVERCNAPLCPLDTESLEFCVWYPGEEICSNREFSSLEFIKTQKKISRILGIRKPDNEPRFEIGYFTVDMLNHNFRITNKIHGLDPNKDEKDQLNEWFNYYKGFSKKTRKRRKNQSKKSA